MPCKPMVKQERRKIHEPIAEPTGEPREERSSPPRTKSTASQAQPSRPDGRACRQSNRQPASASRRSSSVRWPSMIFSRASASANQPARSTSGKEPTRLLFGGHSISKRLLFRLAGSKSPSAAKAVTVLPAFCLTSPSGVSRPSIVQPVSSVNSRRAAGFRLLGIGIFTLRDRPSAGIPLRPERPARMDEKNFDRSRPPSIDDDARAFCCHAPPSAASFPTSSAILN